MAKYVANYTTDYGVVLPLREMRIVQIGEVGESDSIDLIPLSVLAAYVLSDNGIVCRFNNINPRYVEVSLNDVRTRYIIPFRPGTQQWIDLLQDLNNSQFGTTWIIRGERLFQAEIDLSWRGR